MHTYINAYIVGIKFKSQNMWCPLLVTSNTIKRKPIMVGVLARFFVILSVDRWLNYEYYVP